MKWILLILCFSIIGCAALSIQKDCRYVEKAEASEEPELYVCRQVLPWE